MKKDTVIILGVIAVGALAFYVYQQNQKKEVVVGNATNVSSPPVNGNINQRNDGTYQQIASGIGAVADELSTLGGIFGGW